ncbi:unnamed protein product [Rodentolepis nana]|uniref:Serine/threonine-protein kinase PLK4 n=1 Tax=Rodentolepis nana TaxID=102285 RepID=A0A158QH33_RODNA|nr:unnamed protein product [Rodentolepis nana]
MIFSFGYLERRLHDFQVFELLGRGGFAQVYRAKSVITGQEVAIKMIDKKYMYQHGLTHRVQREVEIHSRLKHPSILELYTCFEDANYVYLVLEVCDNGELQAYIRQNGPVSEDMARHYMKQIVNGLLYLHSHKILHRDLTLANLLLTKDMKVKIADFGLATLIEPGENHNTMCGTPNYISPEVVSRGQQVLETDVWSLGIMLYTLVVGHPPFDTREVRSTLNRVLAGNYEMPSHLSPECTDLIICLLRQQPQDRIKLAEMIHHPFITRMSDGGTPRNKMERSRDSGFDSITRTSIVALQSNQSQKSINVSAASSSRHSLPFRSGTNILPPLRPSSRISSLDTARRRLTPTGSLQHLLPPSKSLSGLSIASTNTSLTSTHSQCRSISAGSLKPPHRPTPLLSPLTSRRLRPMRTKTRMAVINILADESVCLEFFEPPSPTQKQPTGKEQQLVVEVMGISPDGNVVVIYYPNGGRGVPPNSDSPVSAYEGDTCKVYRLAQLPEKYWKKYQFVSRFISMAKMHTPKVTLYTSRAKCILMERVEPQAEFELELLADGSRVTCLGGEHAGNVQVISPVNGTFTVNQKQPTDNLPSCIRDLITYAEKCRRRCIEIESSLEKFSRDVSPLDPESTSPFPVIIGRRPNIAVTSKPLSRPLIPSSPCLSKLVANCRNIANSNDHNHRSTSQQRDPIFVPSVGWVSQPSSEELQVQFNDGARLVVVYTTATVHSIRYQPPLQNGQDVEEQVYSTVSSTNPLPPDVRSRLEDGLLSIWTGDLKPKRLMQLKIEEKSHPGRRKWYTDFIFLYDIGKIIASTGDRELEFYEMTTFKFYFCINNLDTVPMCLSYGKLQDINQNALIWGDSNGCISILQLTDLADLLRQWRSMQLKNAIPTMSISSIIMNETVSFVRWKTHDEWVAKVWDLNGQICQTPLSTKICPKNQVDVQCCNFSQTTRSLVIVTDKAYLLRLRSNHLAEERNWNETHQSWEYFSGCLFGNPSQPNSSMMKSMKTRDRLLWEPVRSHKLGVSLCKYNASFNHLITAGVDSSIRVWNFSTGQLISEITDAHCGEQITCMCFDLTERRLITGGRDGYVRIWNHNSGACLMEVEPKSKNGEGFIISAVECKIIGTGRYIVVVGWNPRICLYLDDLETFLNEANHEIKQHLLPHWRDDKDTSVEIQEDICAMAISRSSNLLATADFIGEICVWDAVSGHVLKRLEKPDDRKGGNISGLLFLESREKNKNGACLVSCGPSDTIHFWSIHADAPEFAAFHSSSMEKVAPTRVAIGQVCEDGRLVDSYLFTSDEMGWVQVWNIRHYALSGPEMNQPPKLYTWRCHTASVTGIEAINDRKLLVTTSWDFCARLWTWRGCFIGTFGQPIKWDIPRIVSLAVSQMGPFDVLVNPKTQIVPEYQSINANILKKNVNTLSRRRWGGVVFDGYSEELFGETWFKSKEINNIIGNAMQHPEDLYKEAKISKVVNPASIGTGLSVNESHLRIFNRLLVYPLDPECSSKWLRNSHILNQ